MARFQLRPVITPRIHEPSVLLVWRNEMKYLLSMVCAQNWHPKPYHGHVIFSSARAASKATCPSSSKRRRPSASRKVPGLGLKPRPVQTVVVSSSMDKSYGGGAYLCRYVIRPFVKSYGDISNETLSPFMILIRLRRSLPAIVANTV